MGILLAHGFSKVYHYFPLHYLPFIARSGQLASKPTLRAEGFSDKHFRSMSAHHDEARGFGDCLHLTLHDSPPILKAKLGGGFPHVCLELQSEALDPIAYDMCRFNIAMTRQLRRNGKPGHSESEKNGSYYGDQQIPVARTAAEKHSMLKFASCDHSMIEVLISKSLALPMDLTVQCFSQDDAELARATIAAIGRDWKVATKVCPAYKPNKKYANQVRAYIDKAIANPAWRGDGLEFDRV